MGCVFQICFGFLSPNGSYNAVINYKVSWTKRIALSAISTLTLLWCGENKALWIFKLITAGIADNAYPRIKRDSRFAHPSPETMPLLVDFILLHKNWSDFLCSTLEASCVISGLFEVILNYLFFESLRRIKQSLLGKWVHWLCLRGKP